MVIKLYFAQLPFFSLINDRFILDISIVLKTQTVHIQNKMHFGVFHKCFTEFSESFLSFS